MAIMISKKYSELNILYNRKNRNIIVILVFCIFITSKTVAVLMCVCMHMCVSARVVLFSSISLVIRDFHKFPPSMN